MGSETIYQLFKGNADQPSIREVLPEKEAEHFASIVKAYMTRRLGSQRHAPSSVNRDISVIKDMVSFTGNAPWRWTEEDFDKWCEHLVRERSLVSGSERTYQGAIRRFLDYIVKNVRYRNEIRQEYDIHIVQICNDDNCIPHVVERELSRERQAVTHEEIEQLFDSIDKEIVSAGRFGSKDLYPLMRDKSLFFTVYSGGLRASEALGLNVGSFSPNPRLPELGDFGFVSVWGKGSKGSGPKHRDVPITHIDFPAMMMWYLETVRPRFLKNADPNEVALFLSERGKRMGLSTFEARFHHVMDLSGLSDRGYSPHCLRHSSVTHESLRMSLEANRRKHGHVYAATTQGYNHLGDEYIEEEIRQMIEQQINQIKGDK